MTRKVISVICYVVAGFFAYMVSLLAFINMPPSGFKWAFMGVMMIPAIIALGIGLLLTRFQNWKRDTGIVLLSGSGVTAMVALQGVCMYFSPEFTEVCPNNKCLSNFSDVLSGGCCLLVFCLTGMLLILLSRRRQPDKTPQLSRME